MRQRTALVWIVVLLGGGVASAEGDPVSGEALFHAETFGGNGRTCATCHTETTAGVLTLEEIERRYQTDPEHAAENRPHDDPLFRAVDSDDGVGESYSRLRRFGTFRVRIDLHPNVRVQEDPTRRQVEMFRAVPTVFNVAAEFEVAARTLAADPHGPVFLADGRAATLEEQAAGAVLDHFGVSVAPADPKIIDIAAYVKTLFDAATPEHTDAVRAFAAGGAAPVLPAGNTESEIRGRAFFDDDVDPETRKTAACAFCHSGPMLNEVNGVREKAIFGQGQLLLGDRFVTILVSENQLIGTPRIADGPEVSPLRQPIYTWVVEPDENGEVTEVRSTDPGRMLTTGRGVDRNRFKVPTLWGSKDTAPFFHDNSARTVDQLLEHYRLFFVLAQPPIERNPPIVLTVEDAEDIIAFLKLL